MPLYAHRLGAVISFVILSVTSLTSQALPFSIGPVEGEFDSKLSLKNNWAVAKPNHHFIGSNNGGRGVSTTSDNGRLNFSKGDSFSRLYKGEHTLHLKYNDYGLVLSGQYWYDFVTKDQTQPFSNITDQGRYVSSRSSGAEWQQAFVYHHYQLADKQGTIRLGRQFLNWGEERFIGGGINVINPLDKREGWQADLDTRAKRLPVSLLSVSQQLTDNLSSEFFYQLDWRSDANGNCGSFFTDNDYTTHGCNNYLRTLRGTSRLSNTELANLTGVNINNEGVLVAREKDHRAKTSGQFGLAVHYYVDPLQTDLSFYFINYHSRTGFVNGRTANQAIINRANALADLAPEWLAGHSSYFIDYPENIRLYGLSFSKDIAADLIWRGEFSYRPNMPVQINTVQLFDRSLGTDNPIAGHQKIKGYDRKKVSQLQTSLSKTANQVMGAQEFNLTGSLGMVYVAGLGNDTRYGRDAVFGDTSNCTLASRYCEKQGFTTRFAWGYRIRAEWQYQDIWTPRLTFKPNITWLHDIQGYSPSNEAVFIKDRKAISLGVTAEYLKTYYTGINYTNFWGGRYNRWSDRDFMSVEMGLKF